MSELVVRFPMQLPICPQCGEPGLHKDGAACVVELANAIRIAREQAPIAVVEAGRVKGRTPQWLRRDRCDLPKTDVTKKP